ncbi:MAG: T9SS type A sorting domain-containing protein [Saprospiraceae bacterium]|nr:T9SS type A sorting domain-containing protein [Saprospiraceae bacterium]
MKNFFITALLLIFGTLGVSAQVCYADFEGPGLNFLGLDGVLTSPVPNPNPNAINSSANCAKYVKSNMHAYSLILADNGAPFDLSVNNQFKIDILATVPTQFIFKLEGSGGGFEKTIDIVVAGEWVTYTIDFSAQAFNPGLSKIVMFFDPGVETSSDTYYFDNVCAGNGQICHADFEGPGLNFLGLDGVLTAPVPNPTPNFVNNSANVAQYVKSDMHAYSLILADNGTPFDLSVNNQFKIDVLASVPTQFIFKLEGAGGGFEITKNIAVTGAWQTYTLDFSAQAANTGLSKIILFFDPGVETSSDTYYFDNVCTVPNPCPNDTPDPNMIDDFECNRNATYTGDWSFLSVVTNPAPTVDNNSAKVGRFDDPSGPGTEWSNIQIDYENPIDLSVRNRFSVQVWAPKAGNLLIKLEGGPNAPMEVATQVTELNKWVTYTADFSSQIGKGHKKFVIFFNAGVNGEPGDVYYIDNIKLSPKPSAPPIEDFQGGIHLGWQALDQNEPIHGVFQGPINNPSPNGVNNSTQVGCYTKGSSAFSTLQGISLTNFDLSVYGQINLDVLSPQGGGTVTLILSSATEGNKEAEATITTPGEWETLSFDFSAFSGITNFSEVRIIFNAGTVNAGQTWYFDNLGQSEVTIDPCVDVVPIPNIIDDFECQRNYGYGAGNDQLSVINNPHLEPANGSLKVGEYKDPANEPWTALCVLFPDGIDFSLYNHLSMQVYGPAEVPMLFKLEGGSSPAMEIWDTLHSTNTWHKFDIDFSAAVGQDHKRLCVFFNAGKDNPETTYFIDNIRWARAGYNGCIVDHETAATTLDFKYFANGHLEAEGYQFEVVDNPNASGINASSKVGKFVKASDGAPFAGMYSSPDLEAPIDWKGVKTVKAKVLMDHIGNFAVKVEGSATGAPAFEIAVANTLINQWEALTFNFAAVPDNGEYRRITLFFDLGFDATGTDVTSYFDDIVIGDGQCITVSTFNPADAAPMRVSPNPTADYLLVENMEGVVRLEVFDLVGRRVAVANTSGDTYTDLDVSQFPVGMYLLNGFDRTGALIGKAKFVKK